MRKLLTIIALTIVLILSATTITLALVKSNFNQVSLNNIQFIDVYYGSKHGNFANTGETEKKVFEEILNNYKKGTKESILSSLFQGAYSEDAKAEIINSSWTFSPNSEKTYIVFTYKNGNLPKITLNGKEYEHETKGKIEYKAVYIEVEKSEYLVKINAYFIEAESADNKTSNFRVQFVAHHDALYNYIVSLNEDSLLFS